MKTLISSILFFSFLLAQNNDLDPTFSAMNQGNYGKALESLNLVITTDSKNAELYRLKAMLHESLAETQEALSAWRMCKKLSKNNSLTLEANNHIQLLRQSK